MRVLLTGASSFTGFWIARALLDQGVEVVGALRGRRDEGEPLRQQRLARLAGRCPLVVEAGMGTSSLLEVAAAERPFDLLWLHGAEVGAFRRADYDPMRAAAATTAGAASLMAASRCAGVIVSGSVFEADEGRGDGTRGAIGAYGLAKSIAWQMLRFAAEERGLPITKLVIAHPFGPLEKPGLTAALLRAWSEGRPAILRHPTMVRDFLPVTWLARAAADLALTPAHRWPPRTTPSAFAEPVASFAGRFAEAMRARSALACQLTIAAEPSSEPTLRVGLDRLREADDPSARDHFWNEYAAF